MLQRISIITLLAFVLVGCGGKERGSKERTMKKGESYSVSQGDVVKKNSPNTLIRVTHTEGKKTTTVSLVEGNATITHPKQK